MIKLGYIGRSWLERFVVVLVTVFEAAEVVVASTT
jgi:hypothetical protein